MRLQNRKGNGVIMKKRRIFKLMVAVMLVCMFNVLLAGTSKNEVKASGRYNQTNKKIGKYGVFLGAEPEDVMKLKGYDTIVIDAQYFTKSQIKKLKKSGFTVYSYLNIGSVENFRSYYKKYEKYTMGEYEHWEEERWVDVSEKEWQNFILKNLAPKILNKGVDGLFIDNVDVYYNFKRNDIFNGVTKILKGLKKMGTYVSINGGDVYVTKYISKYGNPSPVMDAVNQETVFSAIDWEHNKFGKNKSSERKYFQKYIEKVASYGLDVYLLEYTKDADLIKKIKKYCANKGFSYYASSTLELKVP